tara:strand:+ start:3251 stop:4267 length:1017 start_codon:yes stop_codon:yes gene_type:complete
MNLREFSKITGIPISTISKALGDYEDVNINTKNNIIALAKKYKYVPNIYAKTLASGFNFSVGLVLPLTFNQLQKLTIIEFIQKVYSKLNAIGIPVVMIFAKNRKEEIDAYNKLINFHKVRLIILNDIKQKDKRIDYLDKKNINYVTWGRCNKNFNKYTWIDEDIEYGSNLAVEYILSRGHTKIGYIDSFIKTNYFILRKKYFIKSLKNNNIKINRSFFINGNINQKLQIKTKDKIKKMLIKNNEITILLVSSHVFAINAIEACSELNKKIGKDISLISFDTNVLESLAPDITTIRQPITKISNNLVKLIQSKMKNIDKNFHYLYKSKLVVKKSVKKLN